MRGLTGLLIAAGLGLAGALCNWMYLDSLASHEARRAWEIDPKGKTVWEHKDTMHIFRARKR